MPCQQHCDEALEAVKGYSDKEISHISVVGYKPFPWQMAVHKAMEGNYRSGKVYCVKSKRQLGKSTMCENILLQYAFTYGRTWSAFISPTLAQARKIYEEIKQAADPRLIYRTNDTLLYIRFVNQSVINFFSFAQKESLRGYTVSGILILDEAAFIDDQILELVLPWTSVKKSEVVIVSSPKFKSGFFYNYYQRGRQGDPNIVSIDWNDFDTSELLTPDRIEEFRQIMPKHQFRSEILGEFIEEGSGVFATTDETWIHSNEDYRELYMGIDFANGDNGDFTCISGFNERGEQVILRYFKDKTPLEQVDEIAVILNANKPKIRTVLAEKNSMGHTFVDMLRQKCPGINIMEFVTSNGSKRDIIELLVAGIGKGECKLIDDMELRKEIACYEMEVTAKGMITYNGYGANDDLVMATAFAWKALNKNRGNYSISIL